MLLNKVRKLPADSLARGNHSRNTLKKKKKKKKKSPKTLLVHVQTILGLTRTLQLQVYRQGEHNTSVYLRTYVTYIHYIHTTTTVHCYPPTPT